MLPSDWACSCVGEDEEGLLRVRVMEEDEEEDEGKKEDVCEEKPRTEARAREEDVSNNNRLEEEVEK